jgi:tetratricopeptide (TPR) repeat protein
MIRYPRLQRLEAQEVEAAQLERAVAYYKDFIAEQPGHDPLLRPELATAYWYVGYLTLINPEGSREEARAALQTARALWNQLLAGEPDVPEYLEGLAGTYAHLGWAYQGVEDQAEALGYFQEGRRRFLDLARRDASNPEPRYFLAFIYPLQAKIHRERGELPESLQAFDEGYRFCETGHGERVDDPLVKSLLASICLPYGQMLYQRGNILEARDVFDRAALLADRLLAAHPASARSRRWVVTYAYQAGKLHAETGEPRQALDAYQRAVQAAEELMRTEPTKREDRVTLGAGFHNIGRLHVELGHPDEAVAAFQRARAVREQLCRDYPDDAGLRRDLAGTHERLQAAGDQLWGPSADSRSR